MPTLYGIYLIANYMQGLCRSKNYHNQLQIKELHTTSHSSPTCQLQRIL
jgi:hypothetical protein